MYLKQYTRDFASIGKLILILGVSYYLFVYLLIALIRINYPFELEWMEGGSVVMVQRILDGQPLYVYPSIDFVPFIYTPLYFEISSLVAHLTGNSFFPLRLVSFLSSLGCLAFIYLIVLRRTSSRYSSFVAICLYAATFRISGAWFDLARVDSLFLLFLLAGIYTFLSPSKLSRNVLSPTLLFLSFYTKQSALIVTLSLMVAGLVTHKRFDKVLPPIVFGVLVAAAFVLLEISTAGWFKYYVFDLPAHHTILKNELLGFWTNDVIRYLPVAICFCILAFLGIGASANSESERAIQDGMILGGLFLTSYFSMIHSGSYENDLMPVYAGVSIYFGIGLANSLKKSEQNRTLAGILILVIAIQFAGLFYSPAQQIPSASDRQQGEKLESLIATFKGDVYMSAHPWYLHVVNKPTQAQEVAVRDIMRSSESDQLKQALVEEMVQAVSERRYEAFVVDSEHFELRTKNFEENYQLVDTNLSGNAFLPVTGLNRKPRFLYVRRTN